MLEASDLWIAAPGSREAVVRGISLRLAPGEWIAIHGANGGGKSTLALALAGLIPPQSGSLTWEGRTPAEHLADPGRRPLLAVLQDPTSQLLQPTVREELAFTAINLGQAPETARAMAEEWAARFDLTSVLEQDPHTLSAGNQQLVLLLAALLCRPGLLVADEAGAHLDDRANDRVMAALDEARADGAAVVWVTQRDADRARIGRELRLGPDDSPLEMAPVATRDTRPRGTRLEIEVSAEAPAAGVRVRVPEPMRLTIGERGVTGLIGPNGAGKSVMLGCAAGVVNCPQVTVQGRERLAAPPLLVGEHSESMVFEERVGAELAFAAVSRGRSRSEVERDAGRMLARLGFDLATLSSRRTWTLSVGEKRVVELVAALVAPSGLLVLDEPTAGLDPRRRLGLAELVRLHAETNPVLVASQDRGWLEWLEADLHELGARTVQ